MEVVSGKTTNSPDLFYANHEVNNKDLVLTNLTGANSMISAFGFRKQKPKRDR